MYCWPRWTWLHTSSLPKEFTVYYLKMGWFYGIIWLWLKKWKSLTNHDNDVEMFRMDCPSRQYAVATSIPCSISPSLPLLSTWTGPHRHLSLTRASWSSGLFFNEIILIFPWTKLHLFYFLFSIKLGSPYGIPKCGNKCLCNARI